MYVVRLLREHHQLLLDLLDFCHTLLHLPRLCRLVAKTLDKHFHVSNVALLSRALGAELFKVFLALMQVSRVVASIGYQHAIFQRGYMTYASVHKGAVV